MANDMGVGTNPFNPYNQGVSTTDTAPITAATTQATGQATTVGSAAAGTIPPATTAEIKESVMADLSGDAKPELKAPTGITVGMSMSKIAGLSSEALMQLLGFEERKEAVNSGISAIETKRQERAAANQERIEKLQEFADKVRKEAQLSPFLKAFKILGAILGMIAGIAAIATGNPVAIAGGILMIMSCLDSILSTATDGEFSLSGKMTELLVKMGMSEETANWVMLGISLAVSVAAAVMTCGASLSGSAANIALQIGNAVTQVGSGACQIAQSVFEYQKTNIMADQKDLEAILQRIQMAMDMDTENMKKIMEKSEKVSEQVKEMINNTNQAVTAVATGGTTAAPAMA